MLDVSPKDQLLTKCRGVYIKRHSKDLLKVEIEVWDSKSVLFGARRSVVGLLIWNKSFVQYGIEETQIYGIK